MREGKTLRLTFRHAGGLQAAGGAKELTGFEVAGSDGLFHAATARIEGETIVVKNPEVSVPCAVRYGWQPFTRANLVNRYGLPASTFAGKTSDFQF